MHHPPRAYGHLIKAGRLGAGLSQRQLAELIGVHPQTVADLERGRLVAGPETTAKMADIFGLPLDRLYVAAQRIPPDMLDYIRTNPRLMTQIRTLMDARAEIVKS